MYSKQNIVMTMPVHESYSQLQDTITVFPVSLKSLECEVFCWKL